MSKFNLYGKKAEVDAVVHVDGKKYYLLDNGEQSKAALFRHDQFESDTEHPEYVINTDD